MNRISVIITDMIYHATQEYDQSTEELEESYEKKVSQCKNDYEKTKYNELQSYYQLIYSDKDPTTEEYQLLLERFPMFPDGFMDQLCLTNEAHMKELDILEMKYMHEKHSLEMKYNDLIRKIDQLRSRVEVTSHTWFTLFDNDEGEEDES